MRGSRRCAPVTRTRAEEPPLLRERRDQRPERVVARVRVEAVHWRTVAPRRSASSARLVLVAYQDEAAVVRAVAARRGVRGRGDKGQARREAVDDIVAAALRDEETGVAEDARHRDIARQSLGHVYSGPPEMSRDHRPQRVLRRLRLRQRVPGQAGDRHVAALPAAPHAAMIAECRLVRLSSG